MILYVVTTEIDRYRFCPETIKNLLSYVVIAPKLVKTVFKAEVELVFIQFSQLGKATWIGLLLGGSDGAPIKFTAKGNLAICMFVHPPYLLENDLASMRDVSDYVPTHLSGNQADTVDTFLNWNETIEPKVVIEEGKSSYYLARKHI